MKQTVFFLASASLASVALSAETSLVSDVASYYGENLVFPLIVYVCSAINDIRAPSPTTAMDKLKTYLPYVADWTDTEKWTDFGSWSKLSQLLIRGTVVKLILDVALPFYRGLLYGCTTDFLESFKIDVFSLRIDFLPYLLVSLYMNPEGHDLFKAFNVFVVCLVLSELCYLGVGSLFQLLVVAVLPFLYLVSVVCYNIESLKTITIDKLTGNLRSFLVHDSNGSDVSVLIAPALAIYRYFTGYQRPSESPLSDYIAHAAGFKSLPPPKEPETVPELVADVKELAVELKDAAVEVKGKIVPAKKPAVKPAVKKASTAVATNAKTAASKVQQGAARVLKKDATLSQGKDDKGNVTKALSAEESSAMHTSSLFFAAALAVLLF